MSAFAECSKAIFVTIPRSGRRTTRVVRNEARAKAVRRERKTGAILLCGGFSFARRLLRQQGRDLHEIVGEHGGCDPHLKALAALGETALHTATTEQHRDAPLDACAKTLAVLELRTPLIGFALGGFGAAPLRDAHHLDAILSARRHVLLTEEPAIRSIQFGRVSEGSLVA